MVRTFTVLPGARGFDLPDGRSFAADRRGRVRVPDEVGDAVVRSAAMRRYDAILEPAAGRFFPGRGGFVCPCGYAPWEWQTSCPRCGLTWSER